MTSHDDSILTVFFFLSNTRENETEKSKEKRRKNKSLARSNVELGRVLHQLLEFLQRKKGKLV